MSYRKRLEEIEKKCSVYKDCSDGSYLACKHFYEYDTILSMAEKEDALNQASDTLESKKDVSN